jgi:hypothetical protein
MLLHNRLHQGVTMALLPVHHLQIWQIDQTTTITLPMDLLPTPIKTPILKDNRELLLPHLNTLKCSINKSANNTPSNTQTVPENERFPHTIDDDVLIHRHY